jgi:DNA-binding CsgD family transcriptional regulator
MRRWNLGNVEEAFVAATLDSSRWSEAMNCISTETDACGAILLPMSGDPLPNTPVSDQLARATETYFRDGWHLRDLRYNVSIPKFIRKGVVDDFDYVPSEAISRHPYYQEFLASAGLRWFAGVHMRAGDDNWCVSINRRIDQDPFSPDEKSKLARLSQALATAGTFAKALGLAASSATLEAFDLSDTAVVLLNRRAEVVRVNQSADKLLQTGEVRIVGKHLKGFDPSGTAALGRALQNLLWGTSGSALMPPVPLPRPSRNPILAYPLKLPSLSENPLNPAQAAVVLVDPSARRQTPEINMQRSFGLTAAEARLASQISTGDSLDRVCDVIGISKETGRAQLKSIFAKTGIGRQAELVLLMSRML